MRNPPKKGAVTLSPQTKSLIFSADLFFALFWFCVTSSWPSTVSVKVHKLLSQSSMTWTFMISVMGKENEEKRQREVKWLLQHWPCVTSYRYFPLVALESFSNLLHVHREGSATAFERCYSNPDAIEINAAAFLLLEGYLWTRVCLCCLHGRVRPLNFSWPENGRCILLYRFIRSLVARTAPHVCSVVGLWCLSICLRLACVVLQFKCCALCTKQITRLRAKHMKPRSHASYRTI